eukprot:350066-Chlamydomonas_euryale.AAC.7
MGLAAPMGTALYPWGLHPQELHFTTTTKRSWHRVQLACTPSSAAALLCHPKRRGVSESTCSAGCKRGRRDNEQSRGVRLAGRARGPELVCTFGGMHAWPP